MGTAGGLHMAIRLRDAIPEAGLVAAAAAAATGLLVLGASDLTGSSRRALPHCGLAGCRLSPRPSLRQLVLWSARSLVPPGSSGGGILALHAWAVRTVRHLSLLESRAAVHGTREDRRWHDMSLLKDAPPLSLDAPAPVNPPLTLVQPPPTEGGSPVAGPLACRTVLLAVPAPDRADAMAALMCAGAVVLPATDLASLRRAATLSGPQALVVADLRSVGDQLRAGLPALARQQAVVILAGPLTSPQRMELLRDGADHVCRSGRWLEVVTLLEAVLRRSSLPVDPPRSGIVGDIAMDLRARNAHVLGRLLSLTALEFDLLAYFTAHPDIVLSRKTLLGDVWGYDVGGLDTVTVHVRRLRRKLETNPARPRYVQTVWGRGYRLTASAAQDGVVVEHPVTQGVDVS